MWASLSTTLGGWKSTCFPPPVPFKAVEGLADVTASSGQPLTSPLPTSKSLQGQLFRERFPSLSFGDFARCKTQELLCGAEEQSQTPRGLGSCPKNPPKYLLWLKGKMVQNMRGGYHHLMDVEPSWMLSSVPSSHHNIQGGGESGTLLKYTHPPSWGTAPLKIGGGEGPAWCREARLVFKASYVLAAIFSPVPPSSSCRYFNPCFNRCQMLLGLS